MNDQQMRLQDGQWKRPFFTIWTGQAISLVGSTVARFALIWWLTATTGSATVLALSTLVALLPQIVLGPIAGAYVDRWNRRRIMMVADSVIALASLWIAVMFWMGNIQVWHVFVVILVNALGSMFHWPAMQASTSLMVPKEYLARVSGINQALNAGVGSIIGPALGALLLQFLPFHSIMLLDVLLAAFAITPLFFVFIPQPEKTNGGAEGETAQSIWVDLRDGLRYLLGWRGLVYITAGAMIFKIALTPAFSLFPLLVTEHFGGAAPELAALESAIGIGMMIGGLLLGVWGGFKSKVATAMLGLGASGLMITLLGVLPGDAFLAAIVTIFLMGVFISLVDGPLFAVLLSTIAPDMQGRVFMLFGSLVSITSPIGLVIAGPAADSLGVQFWFVIAGLLTLGVAISTRFIPAIIALEEGSPAETENKVKREPAMPEAAPALPTDAEAISR